MARETPMTVNNSWLGIAKIIEKQEIRDKIIQTLNRQENSNDETSPEVSEELFGFLREMNSLYINDVEVILRELELSKKVERRTRRIIDKARKYGNFSKLDENRLLQLVGYEEKINNILTNRSLVWKHIKIHLDRELELVDEENKSFPNNS
jgi:hypothetical protein